MFYVFLTSVISQPISDQCYNNHNPTETSANQWTGFSMNATLTWYGLNGTQGQR